MFEPMTGQVLCGRTYENNDILKAVGSECVLASSSPETTQVSHTLSCPETFCDTLRNAIVSDVTQYFGTRDCVLL